MTDKLRIGWFISLLDSVRRAPQVRLLQEDGQVPQEDGQV